MKLARYFLLILGFMNFGVLLPMDKPEPAEAAKEFDRHCKRLLLELQKLVEKDKEEDKNKENNKQDNKEEIRGINLRKRPEPELAPYFD